MEAVDKPLAGLFSLVKSVSTELSPFADVLAMSLNPTEDCIVALTADCQMLTIPLMNPQTLLAEDIKLLQNSFHGPKPIQGMDVCLKKPLIITCSKDNTLRIWNFLTNEIELLKTFPEDMFCAALHPSGLMCAVGFSDKLRVYHVLVDDIRVCLEVPIKACREAKFSRGGHMLAAANGNSICVYELCTGEKVADLKGHNGKVRSLHWLESGFQILSCGQNGSLYMWDLEGKRNGEYINKGVMYTSTVCADDRVFACGSDRKLLELDMAELIPTQERNTETVLGLLAISSTKGALFASTGDPGKPSAIRSYAYPINGDFVEYSCVSSPVARLRLTPDENFLVVADELGCIVILELKDRNEHFSRNPGSFQEIVEISNWTDEVLLTRAELEDKNTTVLELKTKVEELKLNNEYQQKLKEMNYSENIKEVTDKFHQELEQSKNVLNLLHEEMSDNELEYEEKKKLMQEQHHHDLQDVETDFQAQIMEQVDKYHSLVRERDAHIERLDEQRRILVEAHEQYVESLIADFERKLEEDKSARLQFEDEKNELFKELEEGCRQLEDDIDTEIEDTRKGYDAKLNVAKESTLKYKGENGMLKKKFTVMQQELESHKEEETMLRAREREFHEQIKVLEKEISVIKKEIKSRDVTIGDKEKRIYELKKKNQELEKFKFVLDFKIRELKRQIEPRHQEIANMKDQIRSMDEELEKYHKSNVSLDAVIGTLRNRINDTQKQIQDRRGQAKMLEQNIKGFKGDLQMCMAFILDPVELLKAVDKLISQHGSHGTIKATMDPEVNDEYDRHKEFLAKSVKQLKNALEEEVLSHAGSTGGMMRTNLTLIDEINKQREINKTLKESVQASTGRITHLARVAAEKMALLEKKGTLTLPSASISSGKKMGSERTNAWAKSSNKNLRQSRDSFNENSMIEALEPQTNVKLSVGATDSGFESNPVVMLDRNRKRIAALRLFITELESRISGIGQQYGVAAALPPIELKIDPFSSSPSGDGMFNDSIDLMSPSMTVTGGI